MTAKRSREDGEVEALAMANGLMLLSRVSQTMSSYPDRLFECKTCTRKFTSFQALGGHRASHKKPKLLTVDLLHLENQSNSKTHKCSVCDLEFPIGQALGGHMRLHRAMAAPSSEGLATENKQLTVPMPVLNKSNSKRVMGLDLNLTPYENWVELRIWKVALMLDCLL
ncbi:unnamed protein product [Ilex paraguariensis]|uniref:C2H2-type domain-containing protein n=1 Tax=Ilex paraguariensis TaxID=185542 RepID=A0ABC8UCN4_9AQUA